MCVLRIVCVFLWRRGGGQALPQACPPLLPSTLRPEKQVGRCGHGKFEEGGVAAWMGVWLGGDARRCSMHEEQVAV